MLFPTKTFQEPDKFLSQSTIQSLSSKFTLKGLTCSFPAAPASVNTTDMKKPSGSLAQSPSQNVWFSLATSHRPGPGQWSPSFNFPSTNLFCSWHPASTVQHAEAPSLPLQAHTWSLAAAPLNLEGWLPACPVTANRLWSGQACKLLCHPVGCNYPFNKVWLPSEIPCPWVLAFVLTGLSLLESAPLALGYQIDFSYFVIIQNFWPRSVEPGRQAASQVQGNTTSSAAANTELRWVWLV